MRDSSGTIAELAKSTFSSLEATLFSYEAGARHGDIDAVHDMRVTTRRLRVALSNFASCFPRHERREMKLLLEMLAGALGRVRDLDVMLLALTTLRAELPEAQRPMTKEFASRLRRRRRYHLRRLNQYFNGPDYGRLVEALPAMIAAINTSGEPEASEDVQTPQNQESLSL